MATSETNRVQLDGIHTCERCDARTSGGAEFVISTHVLVLVRGEAG